MIEEVAELIETRLSGSGVHDLSIALYCLRITFIIMFVAVL